MVDDQRVERLYQAALDLPGPERDAFLRRECQGDENLELEVRRLLAHFDAAPDGFLQGPSARWASDRATESVGPYDLEEVLGEGGMGVVYRATQHEPVRRSVALKILKLGMDSKEILARFEAERQALAQLEHANIARVYDAGTTPDGRPYFVMECVDGVPITEFCDANRLTPQERIDLVVQVCRGVQHAHQHGTIHRDLKPTNILVSVQDGKPVPKIIDFGVAKATRPDVVGATQFTQHGQLIGTPEYMSPEQAEGVTVDIRSDIYSLGVVLYELLVGVLPLDAVALREAGFAAMMQMIREEEPPAPSTRVSTLGESASAAADRRRTRPARLARTLRGELDWIAMKALAKNREERYSSVAEFGADLVAHLHHEPVRARPAGRWYLLRKFARRHRVGVGFVAVIATAVLAQAIVMTVQARRIGQERDRSNREAAVAQEVKDFLVGLFEESDPASARGREVTAREVLDRGAEQVEALNDPEVRAELLSTIGNVYRYLGLYDEAEGLLEHSNALWTETLGADAINALVSLNHLGSLRVLQGSHAEAESLFNYVREGWRRRGGPVDPRSFDPSANLASVYRRQDRLQEAQDLYTQLLADRTRLTGPDDPEVLRLQTNLAETHHLKREDEVAIGLYRAALPKLRSVLGDDHPQTLSSITALARIHIAREEYEEGERLLREAIDGTRRVYGEDHAAYVVAQEALAIMFHTQDDHAAAEPVFREILENRVRVLGAEHPNTLVARNNLAAVYNEQGRYADAESLARETLETQVRVLGPEHRDVQMSQVSLAILLARRKSFDRALDLIELAVENGFDHPFLLNSEVQVLLAPLRGNTRFDALMETVRKSNEG